MNKTNKIFLIGFFVFFLSFLFIYLLNNSYSYLDPDFGWHLKVGQDTLESRDAPRINLYNYPLYGESWINHEWLTDLGLYVIYDKISYHVIHFFFALLFLATIYFSLKLVFKKHGFWPSFFASIFFVLLGTKATLPHLGIRPQELALFFTVLVLYFLNRGKRLWLYLPIIFLIWANLHGSYILALGLILAWQILLYLNSLKIFQKLLSFFRLKVYGVYRRRNWLLLPLSFVATLINPYGLSLYNSLFEYSNTYYLKTIAEWLSQFYYPFAYWQLAFLAISFAFFLVYYYENYKKRNLNAWQIFLFLFFFVLAFKSRRHFPLFVVVNLPFLTESFLYLGRQLKDLKPTNLMLRFNLFSASLVSVLFFYVFLSGLNYHHDPFVNFCYRYPCQAVQFLKNNEHITKDLNIFNDYGWGGFMIWNYPEKLLFIDGRMPHYPYKGKSYLEEYHAFTKSEEEFLGLVEEYEVEMFFINQRNKMKEPKGIEDWFFSISELNNKEEDEEKFDLFDYLKENEEWYQIYKDHIGALIYIKNYEVSNLPAD
jgi:hypothetical protein